MNTRIENDYAIEKHHTTVVSLTTGVSPRKKAFWRIVRVSDGKVIETSIGTLRGAKWILRGLNK